MPIIVTPYVPTYITVHLGTPDSDAENVTVAFLDYIKNVASSEVYPTWHVSALRANILAQVSFVLNRVYTEFYPSQGYDFNITASTAYDQKFIKGRNIFESVSTLVDALFTSYLRRPGFAEPLAASFCNGTTSTCDGLSQWGSEHLAQEGYNSVEILQHYYGENLEIVNNAPIQNIQYSYPGVDGIIGKSTWYMMVHLYTGILRLSELVSQGQTYFQLGFTYEEAIYYGQQGEAVSLLQYLLSILSEFYLTIPFLTIDGIFGDETLAAVKALQQDAGLEQTGVVNEETWNVIVDRFLGIDQTVLSNPDFFPYQSPSGETVEPETLQEYLATTPGQFPGFPLVLGSTDSDQERSNP